MERGWAWTGEMAQQLKTWPKTWFGPQNIHGGSQPPVTVVLGYQSPTWASSGIRHSWVHIHICRRSYLYTSFKSLLNLTDLHISTDQYNTCIFKPCTLFLHFMQSKAESLLSWLANLYCPVFTHMPESKPFLSLCPTQMPPFFLTFSLMVVMCLSFRE